MESPTRPIKKRKTGMNSSIATLTENDPIANINSIRDLIEVAKNTKKQRNADFLRLKSLLPEFEETEKTDRYGFERIIRQVF